MPLAPTLPRRSGRLQSAALAAELWVALWLAETMVRLVPFRRYARLIDRVQGTIATPPSLARRTRRQLVRAGCWLPWRPKCLVRAIAARVVLGRRNHATILSLGVDIDAADLAAHAWLEAGGVIVAGREVMPRYHEIMRL